jgi:hypothetical protein
MTNTDRFLVQESMTDHRITGLSENLALTLVIFIKNFFGDLITLLSNA